MSLYFRNPDGTVRPLASFLELGEVEKNRQIRKDEFPDGVWVSTVFLVLDHRHLGEGPPILWETMIFDREDRDLYQERYTSEADAIANHERIVAKLRTGERPWEDQK